ncbi:MAG: CinA family protein [Alphaproteobacteria bacterium]|nr:CinA family protein [Alphaproteobacteria bacterium]
MDKNLLLQAQQILALVGKNNLKIATAESCTGGLLSALLTEIPGASKVFERGFITYSNQAKTEMLGVTEELLARFGAVSGEVAKAMAKGALKNSTADVAVAITGIAGPKEQRAGLVYISVANQKDVVVKRFNFSGDRNAVRMASVEAALEMLMCNPSHS